MNYVCTKQSKIDKLWGRFIKDLFYMQAQGIKVEYVKKGEVLLNGKRFAPKYTERMVSYDPIGWHFPFTLTHYNFDAEGTVKRLKSLEDSEKMEE